MSLAAVFQIGSLGDTIVSIPALRSIQELLPDCSEYALVSKFESNAKVAPSHVFDMVWKPSFQISFQGSGAALQQVMSTASAFSRLRYHRPRYAVYLMPAERSWQQVERDKCFFRAAGVRELIGFRALSDTELRCKANAQVRESQAYLRFRRLWNEASDEKFPPYQDGPWMTPGADARARTVAWLAANRRWSFRRLIALSPFSNSPSKDLSPRATMELITKLEHTMNVEVVVVGGQRDRAAADAICSQAKGGLNACGVLSLEESTALLTVCSLAVCVDSGPMHLASAVGTSSVVIFSRMNTQFSRWLPLGSSNTVLYLEVACAGCRLAECPVPGHPCMDQISTGEILTAIANRLNGSTSRISLTGRTQILEWPQTRILQPC